MRKILLVLTYLVVMIGCITEPIPTPIPTSIFTPTPTPMPTSAPTAYEELHEAQAATPVPTLTPTLPPTATPTPVPTLTPTPPPTATPTPVPTLTPTPPPTATPTPVPTLTPSQEIQKELVGGTCIDLHSLSGSEFKVKIRTDFGPFLEEHEATYWLVFPDIWEEMSLHPVDYTSYGIAPRYTYSIYDPASGEDVSVLEAHRHYQSRYYVKIKFPYSDELETVWILAHC